MGSGSIAGAWRTNRTPKNVLVAADHALHEIERAHVHGIVVSEPKLDWAAVIDREKQMISHIPARSGA
jgi:glutathione reductase (NADPH)